MASSSEWTGRCGKAKAWPKCHEDTEEISLVPQSKDYMESAWGYTWAEQHRGHHSSGGDRSNLWAGNTVARMEKAIWIRTAWTMTEWVKRGTRLKDTMMWRQNDNVTPRHQLEERQGAGNRSILYFEWSQSSACGDRQPSVHLNMSACSPNQTQYFIFHKTQHRTKT